MTPPSLAGGAVSQGVCRDFARSSKLEWLETNGTGAFAMGTVAGVNTRRYHALLVASPTPGASRRVLLARVEEETILDGRSFALGACHRRIAHVLDAKSVAPDTNYYVDGADPGRRAR